MPPDAPAAALFPGLRAQATDLLSPVVALDPAALDRLAARLSMADVQAKAQRVGLPLKFGSPMEELNFHAVLALLGFGGAYEGGHPRLLAESAKDTILFGLIGLHLSKANMHAGFLLTVTRSDVASFFGIDPMESVPHESIPAIHVERPGPLSKLVDDLVQTMKKVGARLKELGEPDLAHFILSTLRNEPVPTAARLVSALGVAFPSTFGEPLTTPQGGSHDFVCHKKALVLAGELYHRLRETFTGFDFKDFGQAPGYVTPTIITHLIRLGVLRPTQGGGEEEDEAAKVKLLGEPTHVVPLTAAAVLALDGLTERLAANAETAEGKLAPLDVSYYLDHVWEKEDGQDPQQGQAQSEQEQGQGQQQQQQQQQQEGAGLPAFIPPRTQTVM